MKTLPALLLAASAGAVGGALSASLFDSSAPTARGQEVAAVTPGRGAGRSDDVGDAGLRSEVAELRAENENLRMRVELLETREDEVREPLVETALSPALQEEMRTWMASVEEGGSSSPDFVISVEQALTSIREREREAKQLASEERRIARTEARLDKLADRLGMNAHQVADLRNVWAAQEDAKKQLADVKKEGDREAFRAMKRSFEEQRKADIARIFTAEQEELFWKIEARREKDDQADDSSSKKKKKKESDRRKAKDREI